MEVDEEARDELILHGSGGRVYTSARSNPTGRSVRAEGAEKTNRRLTAWVGPAGSEAGRRHRKTGGR